MTTSAILPESFPPAEAAYTKRDMVYPGYVNLKRQGEGYVLTLRGDPVYAPSQTVQMALTAAELRGWLREANNLLMAP